MLGAICEMNLPRSLNATASGLCPEIPGANGQWRTKQEAPESLAESIALILEDRREDSLRGVPVEAEREKVVLS